MTGVYETINPKRGGGVVESCIILAIVGFVMYANVKGIKLTPEMGVLFGIVTGWLVGKNGKGVKKDGDK